MTLPTKYAAMRKAAEAATRDGFVYEQSEGECECRLSSDDEGLQSPHQVREHCSNWLVYEPASVTGIFTIEMCDYSGLDDEAATHIATSKPQAVLELLAEYEAALERESSLRKEAFNMCGFFYHNKEGKVTRAYVDRLAKTVGYFDPETEQEQDHE